MRKLWYYIVFFIVFVVIIIPSVMVRSFKSKQSRIPMEHNEMEFQDETYITVFVNSVKKTKTILLDEYVKGVVAAEMPASFDMEAIKAQAVAARTYVYKRCRSLGGLGCALHPEADVCDDPSHCQGWITKSEMLKKWGIFSYYHYYSKINQGVNSTSGMVIMYRGEPIDPLFFSTSNGKTENSEDVWDKPIPYLRSVASPGEESSPRFFTVVELPVEDVVSQLKRKWPDLFIDSENPEKQWKVIETSEGGRIKSMQISNKVIKGTEFRQLLNLKSTDFKWERSGENIKIMSVGFGHGVGMSQYGANSMAKDGANYEDILKHYYSGVEIRRIHPK